MREMILERMVSILSGQTAGQLRCESFAEFVYTGVLKKMTTQKLEKKN